MNIKQILMVPVILFFVGFFIYTVHDIHTGLQVAKAEMDGFVIPDGSIVKNIISKDNGNLEIIIISPPPISTTPPSPWKAFKLTYYAPGGRRVCFEGYKEGVYHTDAIEITPGRLEFPLK